MASQDTDHARLPHSHSEDERSGERGRTARVVNIGEIIAEIEQHADAPDHESRTRVLVDNRDQVLIISGYQPGEGETLHGHPTHNTLYFPKGVFDVWVVGEEDEEEHYEAGPGTMVILDRGQPHRVQARDDQDGLAFVMVSIIEGKPTSDHDYSFPYYLTEQE